MEFIGSFDLACGLIFLLSCALIYTTYSIHNNSKYLDTLREEYFKLAGTAEVYLFEYDIPTDMLTMSQPCASLLKLPTRIEHYMAAMKDPSTDSSIRNSLAYIDAAIGAEHEFAYLKIYRPNNSLGVFRARSEIFRNSRGKANHVLGLFADVTEEFQRQEKLQIRAQLDTLTKVYNSNTTRQQISQYVSSNTGIQQDALLLLDIDHFKKVNDTLGHQAGDRTLQILASCLKTTIRTTDFLGRLGGDEFCIYLHNAASQEFVCSLCDRINTAVTKRMQEEGIQLKITVSIGGAMLHPDDDFESIYARADRCLYTAKNKGRNTFHVAA